MTDKICDGAIILILKPRGWKGPHVGWKGCLINHLPKANPVQACCQTIWSVISKAEESITLQCLFTVYNHSLLKYNNNQKKKPTRKQFSLHLCRISFAPTCVHFILAFICVCLRKPVSESSVPSC